MDKRSAVCQQDLARDLSVPYGEPPVVDVIRRFHAISHHADLKRLGIGCGGREKGGLEREKEGGSEGGGVR